MRSLVESSPQAASSTPAQTSVGDTAGLILAANGLRKGFMVQNTGTTILYLSFSTTSPTAAAYHIALKDCAVANDGTGGVYVDDAWVGEVRAIGSAAGGACVVTEFTAWLSRLGQGLRLGKLLKLSVLIPSRTERFLEPTVRDVLAKARGDIEVIVVLDGYWPVEIMLPTTTIAG